MGEANATEQNAFERLEAYLQGLDKQALASELWKVGVVPERFAHDSSEEKLWSKFSDILLAQVLTALGLPSQVLRTRGNSADVYSQGPSYTLVSDAKCFRLSRSAKNQKDFKIEALDDWRRQDTYALLVAPLYQYPSGSSQIYAQAVRRNVTLLAYTHLYILLQAPTPSDLSPLWQVGQSLPSASSNARVYWSTLESRLLEVAALPAARLAEAKALEQQQVQALVQEGLSFWQGQIVAYQALSREEAIAKLIASQKIDQKIAILEKTLGRLQPQGES